MNNTKLTIEVLKKLIKDEITDWNGSWELPGRIDDIFDSYFDGYRIFEHIEYFINENGGYREKTIEGVFMTWAEYMNIFNTVDCNLHSFVPFIRYNGEQADCSYMNDDAKKRYLLMPKRYWSKP